MELDPQYAAILAALHDEKDPATRDGLVEDLHARYLALVRGGQTAGGLPYPDPTDPVAEGADAIRALAEATYPTPTAGGIVPGNGWNDSTAVVVRLGSLRLALGSLTAGSGSSGTLILTVAMDDRPPTKRPAGIAYMPRGANADTVAQMTIDPTGVLAIASATGALGAYPLILNGVLWNVDA